MEFQCRNDFALIMHLCQAHLPLHCKKCLTVSAGFHLFSSFHAVVALKKQEKENPIQMEKEKTEEERKNVLSDSTVPLPLQELIFFFFLPSA